MRKRKRNGPLIRKFFNLDVIKKVWLHPNTGFFTSAEMRTFVGEINSSQREAYIKHFEKTLPAESFLNFNFN
jgi:hypothetical protein